MGGHPQCQLSRCWLCSRETLLSPRRWALKEDALKRGSNRCECSVQRTHSFLNKRRPVLLMWPTLDFSAMCRSPSLSLGGCTPPAHWLAGNTAGAVTGPKVSSHSLLNPFSFAQNCFKCSASVSKCKPENIFSWKSSPPSAVTCFKEVGHICPTVHECIGKYG